MEGWGREDALIGVPREKIKEEELLSVGMDTCVVGLPS